MKKMIVLITAAIVFAGCGKKEEQFNLNSFFPLGEKVYSGGFEGSNYEILTEDLGNGKIKQTILTTATAVTRVLKIEKEVKMIFIGEEITTYTDGEQNIEEVIIKTPLSKGYKWTSNEKEFEILDFDGKKLVISKKFTEGELITTYIAEKGIVQETYKDDDFENVSKVIE
ncbi:MAG: hypothetical protein ACRC6A_04830 [Fusobacteriaceae bacterium]